MSNSIDHLGRDVRPRSPRCWGDAYYAMTGCWPSKRSGRVDGTIDDETWRAIDSALIYGFRALPAHSSLARLLQEQRGVKPKISVAQWRTWREGQLQLAEARSEGGVTLTVVRILEWADAYHRATGL
jgi:hypothetical protein